MAKNDSIETILDFVIENEIESFKFYTDLAAKMDNRTMNPVRDTPKRDGRQRRPVSNGMKQVFLDFAAEELAHRKLLEEARKGKTVNIGGDKIADLKIAEYAVDIVPTPDMDYQAVLILAMKKEKASFALYTDLAAAATEPAAKKLFLSLAQQEAKHKLRFELEYDEVVLKED
jgi:rubrerythrin